MQLVFVKYLILSYVNYVNDVNYVKYVHYVNIRGDVYMFIFVHW